MIQMGHSHAPFQFPAKFNVAFRYAVVSSQKRTSKLMGYVVIFGMLLIMNESDQNYDYASGHVIFQLGTGKSHRRTLVEITFPRQSDKAMSAYGHMMEREFSAQSLSTRGGSEVGSRYTVETGLYITSFAATVLIAGLVTVGVSLMTLLITLAVMLRSCQTQSAGVVETWKPPDDYNYCKMFALHAELNLLPSASFPAMCKSLAVGYIKDGHYLKDLNITVGLIEQYFSNCKPLPDGCDVVLMDIDDLLPEDSFYPYQVLHRFQEHVCSNCIEDVKYLKHLFFRQLYLILKDGGWKLIFLSRKTKRLHNTTAEYLTSAGFGGWSSLIMRTDNEQQMDQPEYFSLRISVLQKEGFRIVAVISSQMDALTGSSLGRRVFKLPNPIFYFQMGHYTESGDVLK